MPEQEFERRSVAVRHEQRVTVIEGIRHPTPIPYGRHNARRWAPTRLVLTFERSRVGDVEWSPWVMLSASARGFNLRTDGAAGRERNEWLHGFPDDEPELLALWARVEEIAEEVDRDGVRTGQPEPGSPMAITSDDAERLVNLDG